MSDIKTIIIDDYSVHEVGNNQCRECWSNYPKKCECGGLIHACFGDYTDEDSFYLNTKCDKCGESE